MRDLAVIVLALLMVIGVFGFSSGGDKDTQGGPPLLDSNTAIMELSPTDPQLEIWQEWSGGAFDPEWEMAAYWLGWDDPDGDLGGGKQYVALDGGDPIITDIPADLYSWGEGIDETIGLRLDGSFAALGRHTIQIWVVDRAGNTSGEVVQSYDVGGDEYSIGQRFTNFTLRGYQKDSGISDYTLDDYLGQVVLINSFAGWCPPCDIEAPELDILRDEYAADPVQIFSLESEDAYGYAPDDSNMEKWTLYHYGIPDLPDGGPRDQQLTGVILADPYENTAGPYFLAGYIPSNFFLDKNHIIRLKTFGRNIELARQTIDYLKTLEWDDSDPEPSDDDSLSILSDDGNGSGPALSRTSIQEEPPGCCGQ